MIRSLLYLILVIVSILQVSCKAIAVKTSIYQDLSHKSKVFKKDKTYRIYLPKGYKKNKKSYPVIYYFHGWGGRYFKDDNARLSYNRIGELVDKYQTILVMWDGNMDPSEPRPYNIGYHQHVKYPIQMKDYFIELVDHIDEQYNTRKDRGSRAIIGYSMGGIMSYYLAGKYPHLISSAVNLTGSPEFFIGYPENHTLYPLRYTFENLRDVRLRFHNSSIGELSDLNREVNNGAKWDGNLAYEYYEFNGGHKVDNKGETIVFDMAMKFVSDGFYKVKKPSRQWSHYDLYNDFEVWGYQVKSSKKIPGFIYLKDVTLGGFGYYSKAWLPNGPKMDFASTVTTAAVYNPNQLYHIVDFNQNMNTFLEYSKKADSYGKLKVEFVESNHEIGIYKSGDNAIIKVVGYRINETSKMLKVTTDNSFKLELANLGELPIIDKEIKISIVAPDTTVLIAKDKISFLLSKERIIELNPILINCKKQPTSDGSPHEIKLKIMVSYDSIHFEQELIIPVFYDVPLFDSISVKDGIVVNGTRLGIGNGNGQIDPGEEIMIYQGNHRVQLFYDDPYITKERLMDETLPGKWKDDGTSMSSVINISEDCPIGHQFELLAKYETKYHMPMKRNVIWGTVSLMVNN